MKLKRYRLTLEDVQRLSKVWSVRISRVRLICTQALCALLFMGLGASIVFLSPLKRRMPGFMTEMQRQDVIGALARMDTLGLVMASNQAYIDNVKTLMDTSREPADSARASVRIGALPLDSLKTASPAERRFVASMAEREKYNLNVLSPVAADAVIFSDPSDGGIIVGESRTASML